VRVGAASAAGRQVALDTRWEAHSRERESAVWPKSSHWTPLAAGTPPRANWRSLHASQIRHHDWRPPSAKLGPQASRWLQRGPKVAPKWPKSVVDCREIICQELGNHLGSFLSSFGSAWLPNSRGEGSHRSPSSAGGQFATRAARSGDKLAPFRLFIARP